MHATQVAAASEDHVFPAAAGGAAGRFLQLKLPPHAARTTLVSLLSSSATRNESAAGGCVVRILSALWKALAGTGTGTARAELAARSGCLKALTCVSARASERRRGNPRRPTSPHRQHAWVKGSVSSRGSEAAVPWYAHRRRQHRPGESLERASIGGGGSGGTRARTRWASYPAGRRTRGGGWPHAGVWRCLAGAQGACGRDLRTCLTRRRSAAPPKSAAAPGRQASTQAGLAVALTGRLAFSCSCRFGLPSARSPSQSFFSCAAVSPSVCSPRLFLSSALPCVLLLPAAWRTRPAGSALPAARCLYRPSAAAAAAPDGRGQLCFSTLWYPRVCRRLRPLTAETRIAASAAPRARPARRIPRPWA